MIWHTLLIAFFVLLLTAVIGVVMVAALGGGGEIDDPMQQVIGDAPGFSAAQLDELARSSRQRLARDPLRRSLARREES